MKHTFLFEQGKWQACEHIIDESGSQSPVEGGTTITHSGDLWINEGWMKVLSNSPVKFTNKYEIIPFSNNQRSTTWVSSNPVLGKLFGNFIIIDDSILFTYTSSSNQYHGLEYLYQINESTYLARGALMKDNLCVSSWAVELRK